MLHVNYATDIYLYEEQGHPGVMLSQVPKKVFEYRLGDPVAYFGLWLSTRRQLGL